MGLKYLHTMVRVKDLEATLAFYALLGLKETRRNESEKGRFTLIFMAPEGQEDRPIELTYNWGMCFLISSLIFSDLGFRCFALALALSFIESCPNDFILSKDNYLNVKIFIRIKIFE